MQRKFSVKLFITLLLLAYLGYKIDWAETKEVVSNIHLLPFICSYLVLLLCFIPLALRLRILLKPTVLQFGLKRLVEVQFISRFYSLLLPSGIGISVARWFTVTKNKVGRRVFVVVTLIERMMLTLTLVLCAGIPLFFVKDEATQTFRSSALPVLLFLIAACILFFSVFLSPWVYKKFSSFMRWVESKLSSELVVKALRIYEDCSLYLDRRELLPKAFMVHILYLGLSFVQFYLIFVALGLNMPFITILWISMMVRLLLILPLSLGGVGMRETGFAWLLTLYGIAPEKGVFVGGMISVQFFLNVGLGAILNVFVKRDSYKV